MAFPTRYSELRARGGIELHAEWTDATTPVMLTPDFPGTRGPGRTKLLGDIDGSANVTNIRTQAGAAIDLPGFRVHATDRVAVDYTGGALQIRDIATEPSLPDAVVADSALIGVKVGADVWLYSGKSEHAWEVVYMHIENGPVASVKYEFTDEAGSPVTKFGPIYMGVDSHRTIDMPWRNTVDDRIMLKADKAGAGSITLWVMRESV